MSNNMTPKEKNMLVQFGIREAEILNRVESDKLCESRSEAVRRGLSLFEVLHGADEKPLLALLSNSLHASAVAIDGVERFHSMITISQALAKGVRAVLGAKYGILATEYFESYVSTLDSILLLPKDRMFKELDRAELRKELLVMSDAIFYGPPGIVDKEEVKKYMVTLPARHGTERLQKAADYPRKRNT